MAKTKASLAGLTALLLSGVAVPAITPAMAQDFDWRAHEGETVTFLVNSNPIGNLLVENEAAFEELTGIDLVVDVYQEQQMRQRLLTVMNARSDEVDVFMTLPSREGRQFAAAGWYKDLSDYVRERRLARLRLRRFRPGPDRGGDVRRRDDGRAAQYRRPAALLPHRHLRGVRRRGAGRPDGAARGSPQP